MNRFDARKRKIIKLISEADASATGKALSMKADCSLRTIQAEIAAINRQVPRLILSTNRGYSLNPEACLSLNTSFVILEENDEHTIIRRLLIAESENHPWKIDDLADYMYLSTTALEKKLKNVAKLLDRFHLKIIREKTALSIRGGELDKRALIHSLILDETNSKFNNVENLNLYCPGLNIEKMRSIVLNSIDRYGYFVENTYSDNIIINLAIALHRMHIDNYINVPFDGMIREIDSEYKIAQEICEQYANHWNITPSVFDISYIASLLIGQVKPLTSARQPNTATLISPEFIGQIERILISVFNEYMLNVDISDMLYNFSLHVDGLLKRVKLASSPDNNILDNVKRGTPFVYEVSVSIVQKIQEQFHVQIPDCEIGYIGIHIGFLIEHSIENSEKVYILLLSDNYYHIGDQIEKKLLENFSDLIELQCLYSVDQSALVQTSSDLILTTQKLNIVGKKVITISPFYTMMDHISIDQAIHNCLNAKKKKLRNQLLLSFFDKDLFFIKDDFDNKESVIRFLGQKIVDFGLADDTFIPNVMKREALSSTCFFDTFAIPHSTEMNARQTMNCVLISKKGIVWDTQRIHLVMMIAVSSTDRGQFMKLYNGIVQMLERPELIRQIVNINTFSEFMDLLKSE